VLAATINKNRRRTRAVIARRQATRFFTRVLLMSLFDLFFGQRPSREAGGAQRSTEERIEPGATPVPAARPAPHAAQEGADERRLRRHARREQLYVAIRESMTRSGVLAATYKFKVLSLDQPGNEFLVMVDLSMAFESITGQLGTMEALIIQNAKARFGITVPTVYWRIDAAPAASPLQPLPAKEDVKAVEEPAMQRPLVEMPTDLAAHPGRAAMRRDPLEADEVAAFRQALLAASARAPSSALDSGAKPLRKASSYTLLTGFEDTELPESAASPALSKTQYGDLH
jgi:hypothetical protein